MMYVKFEQKRLTDNRSKISYCRNKPDSEKIIYKTEYPEQLSNFKKTEKEKIESITEPTEIPPEYEQVEIVRSKNSIPGIMSRFFTLVLMFVGIYLSGIDAPKYMNESIRYMSEITKSLFDETTTEYTNTKNYGEKVFVSETVEKTSEDTGFQSNIITDENLSFAETITSESFKNAGIITTSEETEVSAEEVISKNMSWGSDKIYFTNKTSLIIDGNELLKSEYPIEKLAQGQGTNDPVVLIVHTHGTECYIDSEDKKVSRSTDTDRNIVRVGQELATILKQYGISVIHSKTMHDEISYVKAYENSKAEVKMYLEKYPSIKYVIDIHRDAIANDDDTPVKTQTEINGEKTAQLMFVMGTNASGGNHPNYKKNLTVAAHIQQNTNELYPDLMRPINVRPIIFNQNLSTGCMLLEVGSDANTLDEALVAIRMFGRGFVQTVKKMRNEK